MEEIQDLSKQINLNNLTYLYQGNTAPKTFIGFKDPLDFYKNIEKGYITLDKAEKEQKEFKFKINEIVIGCKRSQDPKKAIKNIKTLTNHKKNLSSCLMIILELSLKLNAKQNIEKVSKY